MINCYQKMNKNLRTDIMSGDFAYSVTSKCLYSSEITLLRNL